MRYFFIPIYLLFFSCVEPGGRLEAISALPMSMEKGVEPTFQNGSDVQFKRACLRGRRGHRGHRGHRGREGVPVAAPLIAGAAQGPTGASEEVELNYIPTGPSGDAYQLLSIYEGYPTATGGPVEFVPANLSNAPQPPTQGSYFEIKPGGAGVYLVHYGLVGMANSSLRVVMRSGGMSGEGLVKAWIVLRVQNGSTTHYYGAAPLSLSDSRANDPHEEEGQAAGYLLSAFGQHQLQLREGDRISVLLYLQQIAGQVGDEVLYVHPDNVVDFTDHSIVLNQGGNLSLIRLGDLPQ